MFSTCCFKEWDIPVWCEFSTQFFQGIISAWLALHCNDWKKSWHLQHYGHQGKPDQPNTVWSRCQLVLKVEPWLSQQTCKGKLKPSKQVLCQLTNKQIPSASCWSNMALPNTTKPWHQLACWCILAIELVPCWASTKGKQMLHVGMEGQLLEGSICCELSKDLDRRSQQLQKNQLSSSKKIGLAALPLQPPGFKDCLCGLLQPDCFECSATLKVLAPRALNLWYRFGQTS